MDNKKRHNIRPVYLFLCLLFGLSGPTVLGQQEEINTGWLFSFDKDFPEDNREMVNIPHTWNARDAFDEIPGYRRGTGWYQKKIRIPESRSGLQHYLYFNGANQATEVWVNGKKVGNHKGGYTAFTFNVTKQLKFGAFNTILVKVDNSHNPDIPPLDADFTFYGGIYRSVWWYALPAQHFSKRDYASDGFYVNYDTVNTSQAQLSVSVLLDNFDSKKSKNRLQFALYPPSGEAIFQETEKINIPKAGSAVKTFQMPVVKKPMLWTPENPTLYRLKISLLDNEKGILEEKWANIAFKWVSISGATGFLLNGRPYKLIGVNRHQDFKNLGNAVPVSVQAEDIYTMKAMGANFLRFAHYPQAQELYSLCDELGILTWSEIPVINLITPSEDYTDNSMNMQLEHIKQYYNYPSMVMIGYMNEIFLKLNYDNKTPKEKKETLKKETVILAKKLEALTRKEAPNHITVMALHGSETYNETGIADIPMLIGWNLYFGWYGGKIFDLGSFLDDQHARYPNRPLLISEYGPGADVRISTADPKIFDFSTDYQFQLHSGYYQQVMERDYMAGMAAWNYADFGSEFRGDAIPHVNQKGLLQFDRTPKDIYYWYKAVRNTSEPTLYIAAEYLKKLPLVEDNEYPVQVYTNRPHVEFFLNDSLLATASPKTGYFTVNVPFKHGKNILRAEADGLLDIKTVDASILRDLKNMDRIGINVGSHFRFADFENNITWLADRPYSKGLFGHKNGEVYNRNKSRHQGVDYKVKGSTSEPLYQTMLKNCTEYQLDMPGGQYKVSLFFLEPEIKNQDQLVYNLSDGTEKETSGGARVFDIAINGKVVTSSFDLVRSYPKFYGIKKTYFVNVDDQNGININLRPVSGEPVLSGILVERKLP